MLNNKIKTCLSAQATHSNQQILVRIWIIHAGTFKDVKNITESDGTATHMNKNVCL